MNVTLHHSADASPSDQAGKVNASHQRRQFPKSTLGFFGGYTYLLEKSGKKVQFRTETEEQAHTYGHNRDNIGICLAGDFTRENPTDAQINALAELLREIRVRWGGIPVYLHREWKATACPGIDLRALAEARLRSLTEYRLRKFLLHIDNVTGLRRLRIERALKELGG